MKLSQFFLPPLAALSMALPAFAGTASGTIVYHNDVAQIPITVSSETDLTIWTNSAGGGNFDPILTLWFGGNLVSWNDDGDLVVDPMQNGIDSVLRLEGLTPGVYLLTVTSFNNHPNGSLLSEGYLHDGETPVPIEQWWNKGNGYYNVNWAFGPVPIPEPSSSAMLLAGLGIVALARGRRR